MISDRGRMNRGIWYAVGAYAFWGTFPVYWKLLNHVPAPQLLCHRILWSFIWLFAVVLVTGQGNAFRKVTFRWRVLPIYFTAALLIGINWLTYVWAVNAGFIVETSLGYFINPLLSVLMGVLFLRERLRLLQWFPIGLAAGGVLYLTYAYGSPPWIGLTLASTWATYGLLKKIAPLGSLHGLTLETGILFLPVLAYLAFSETAAVDFFDKKEGLLMAPAYAVPRMLARANLKLQDFDYYEIHEAFAAQVLCTLAAWQDKVFCKQQLGLDKPLGKIDMKKLNVNGSSLAAGHPFAATGGRIVATLAKMLAQKGSGRGLISICAAGGQGVVAIIER